MDGACLSGQHHGGQAKASVNNAYRDFVSVSSAQDPKPSDLPMDRVNFRESEKEARTVRSYKSSG